MNEQAANRNCGLAISGTFGSHLNYFQPLCQDSRDPLPGASSAIHRAAIHPADLPQAMYRDVHR